MPALTLLNARGVAIYLRERGDFGKTVAAVQQPRYGNRFRLVAMQQLLVDDERCRAVGSSQYRDDQFPRKNGEIASARSHMNVSAIFLSRVPLSAANRWPCVTHPARSASLVFYLPPDNAVQRSGNARPRATASLRRLLRFPIRSSSRAFPRGFLVSPEPGREGTRSRGWLVGLLWPRVA